MYSKFDDAALLIASDGYRDQQTVVHVIHHTLAEVEQGE